MNPRTFVHPTAEVEDGAVLGDGCKVWNWTKVRPGARLGDGCNIGQCVYIDAGVAIGAFCKIQNGVSVYAGVTLGDRVFVGPNVTFTNDLHPRAVSPQWEIVPTVVEEGASLGANCTIRCGVTIGRYAMVGAGAVVTRDVPAFALVIGQPARIVDYVAADGAPLRHDMSLPAPSGDVLMAPRGGHE